MLQGHSFSQHESRPENVILRRARAYSPAGISSFFGISDREINGRPISNPLRIGAIGGGFVISRGVKTEVQVERSRKDRFTVFLNGQRSGHATVTENVIRSVLGKAGLCAKVTIYHAIEPPIGCGYGTSGAGALSTALALSQALDLSLTYHEIGQIAHVAEIKCKTGLGTVGPLMVGGNVVTVKPGAPGLCVIDRIPLKSDYHIITGCFGPMSKRVVLGNRTLHSRINKYGKLALRTILRKPNLNNFLLTSQRFAEKTGFMTERVRRLMLTMKNSGAVGAAQNMLGEAGHALAEEGEARKVHKAIKRYLAEKQIFVTDLEFQGARLIHSSN